jgi:copper homeostasis protein (lipoprotein)
MRMKIRLAWLSLLMSILLGSGCATDSTPSHAAGGFGATPAAFTGALPCADCEALDYALDLFSDRAFHLDIVYRGKAGARLAESGTWELSPEGAVLLLRGRETVRFAIESADSLRLLDREGAAIV